MDTQIASRETKSTCCYCGVGCGVIIEHDGARISGVRGDPDHPANFGRLCTKGATLHLSSAPDARAKFPVLRAARDALGLKRLELYAHPDDWPAIKALAEKLQRRRAKLVAKRAP